MIHLREAASRVDWQQARTDAFAIANKQVSLSQLPVARQDNLQRARDVLTKLALDESYYRSQSLNRLGTYERLKDDYVKYIKTRDEAAYQGKIGSIGLAAAYSVDTVGYGLAAAGVPLAKFYTVVRGIGDKSVAAYDTLRDYMRSPDARPEVATGGDRSTTSPAQGPAAAQSAQGGQIPDMGFRIAHGRPASHDAGSRAGTGAAPPVQSPAPGHTADENIRALTAPAAAVRELHKAAEETIKLGESLPGKEPRKEWTARQQQADDKSPPEQFSASKGAGDIADSTLKTLESIAELDAARRSGDGDRIYKAETEAMRQALKGGSTTLETLQKMREAAGEQRPGGKPPVAAQLSEAFKFGEKVVGATQSAMSGVEAYADVRQGKYDKAWEHAREGATNAAKTFSKYGEQYEAGGKAIDALVKYGQATDTRQKVTSLLEFAGEGTKAGGVIPGATDAGESILKGKGVIEQGFNLKDAYDLGKKDDFKPNLDRLAGEIRGDHELYNRLDAFRRVLKLPGDRRPVDPRPTSP